VAKRRKRRKADDDDFAIQLNPIPGAPNPTMELETADLANMEQSGEAIARPNLVIQLESGKTVELQPGWSQGGGEGSSSVIVDNSQNVVVASQAVGTQPVRERPRAVAELAPRKTGGAWLVVIVYVLATAALAAAIYERYLL
jgi:hypothetical protein